MMSFTPLWSNPISPHMPSPCEIIHNRIDERPIQPSAPIDKENIWNFLIEKNQAQKEHYSQRHGTK